MSELWQRSALELAALIRERQVSSREVVQSHLRRIEAVNPRLNALTVVRAEQAMADAAGADEAIARGAAVGPLHGVPFTVKENIDVAGEATTWGLAALTGAIATEDAPPVASIRAAGGIVAGRTNLPDLALRWDTDNAPRGATLNPWDARLTPGGSSGGEAAALATGMTPLGLANDLGGSLRWPAQCCGVASLKPTQGRIASAAVTTPQDPTPGIQLFNVQGPMARRVADVRAAFEVMTSPSARDPMASPVGVRPAGGRPCRVAVVRDPDGMGVDADVAAGVAKAAAALAAAGYEVEEAQPPSFMDATSIWLRLISVDLALIAPLEPLLGDGARRFLEDARAAMPALDLMSYAATYVERHTLLRQWQEFFASYPLVMAPVGTQPPFERGFDLTPGAALELVGRLRAVVSLNALGLPAAVVPVSIAADMPQAVQVFGGRFSDERCLAAAEAIESAAGILTPIEPRA